MGDKEISPHSLCENTAIGYAHNSSQNKHSHLPLSPAEDPGKIPSLSLCTHDNLKTCAPTPLPLPLPYIFPSFHKIKYLCTVREKYSFSSCLLSSTCFYPFVIKNKNSSLSLFQRQDLKLFLVTKIQNTVYMFSRKYNNYQTDRPLNLADYNGYKQTIKTSACHIYIYYVIPQKGGKPRSLPAFWYMYPVISADFIFAYYGQFSQETYRLTKSL